MGHTPASQATPRQQDLLRIAHSISAHGLITGQHVEELRAIGINILDWMHGLVPDPTAACSRGEISATTALHALTRWAHLPTPPVPHPLGNGH